MIAVALMQTAVGSVVSMTAPDGGTASPLSYRLAFAFLAVMAFVSLVLYSRVEDRRPRDEAADEVPEDTR